MPHLCQVNAPSHGDSPKTPRRRPQQERSQRRLEAILDAAAEVFDEVGLEAGTMEAIAERAGTSIGSLYQFVGNKAELFHALGQRCLDRERAMVAALMTPEALASPWPDLLDAAVDSLHTMLKGDPSFRSVWMNLQMRSEIGAAEDELSLELIALTEKVIARHAKHLRRGQRRHVAIVIVCTITGMFLAGLRFDDATQRGMIRETKIMLRRYISPYTENG